MLDCHWSLTLSPGNVLYLASLTSGLGERKKRPWRIKVVQIRDDKRRERKLIFQNELV
jgi:hypothetical protein